jgi:hypothetical protein
MVLVSFLVVAGCGGALARKSPPVEGGLFRGGGRLVFVSGWDP